MQMIKRDCDPVKLYLQTNKRLWPNSISRTASPFPPLQSERNRSVVLWCILPSGWAQCVLSFPFVPQSHILSVKNSGTAAQLGLL